MDIQEKTCATCKYGQYYRKRDYVYDECGLCCNWDNKWQPIDQPEEA